jgi:hypothetical protein
MRALIAAGLDRSYAAVTEHAGKLDLATELAAVHRRLDEIAARLEERE